MSAIRSIKPIRTIQQD